MRPPLNMEEAHEAVEFLRENAACCRKCGSIFDPTKENCKICIERFRLIKEAKKFQEKMKARQGFKNHVRGIEKLMELKQAVPTSQYLKKDKG
jgi:hypothetical protein